MRKFIIVAAAATALLSACGDDGGSSAANTTAASATTASAAAATAAASATTAAASATTKAAGTATTAAAAAPAGSIEVDMKEWSVTSGPLKAGTVTLNVKNGGQFKHQLTVAKGSYADLPKTASGSVDTATLPAGTLAGGIQPIDGGASSVLTVDLAPGKYTLFCNLTGGGSSHASRGQVLDITVA